MLYVAYGSNLNKGQMAYRCPEAEFVGSAKLFDYRLVFRSVADIEPFKGGCVEVGIWRITDRCLESLDIYEGYPRLYTRFKVEFELDSVTTGVGIVYKMNTTDYGMPSQHYLKSIEDGYQDCDLNFSCLDEALSDTKTMIEHGKMSLCDEFV